MSPFTVAPLAGACSTTAALAVLAHTAAINIPATAATGLSPNILPPYLAHL